VTDLIATALLAGPCNDHRMVLEIADFAVLPGKEEEFVAAYREAVALLAATPGFRSARMTRGIETTTRFVLLVEWDSVEAHTVGFRESADFSRWRELIGPYFDGPPHVEHFHHVD
jgi:heme-degrading monooxygenase HmoA